MVPSQYRLVPLLVGLLMALATVLIWQKQVGEETARLKNQSLAALDRTVRSLQAEMGRTHAVLDSVNRRWVARAGTPETQWRNDAVTYIEKHPALISLHWIDPAKRINWSMPEQARADTEGRMADATPLGQAALEASQKERSVHGTPLALLSDELGPGCWIHAPMLLNNEQHIGWTSARLSLSPWIEEALLQQDDLHGTLIVPWSGGSSAFETGADPATTDWTVTREWTLHGDPLTLSFTPDNSWLQGNRSPLPKIALVVGLIVSTLIAWVVHLLLINAARYRRLTSEIKQRQKAETGLRASEARARTLLDQLPLGVRFHDPQGHLLTANPAFLDKQSHSGELQGKTIASLLSGEAGELAARYDREALDAGAFHLVDEVRLEGEKERIIQVIRVPVVDEQEEVIGLMALERDISEQRSREALERDLDTRLTRARRLDAVGHMIGWVAHDLNNQISPMVAYPELLLDDLPPDSPMRKDVIAIQNSAHRAARIIEDLLVLNPKRAFASGSLDIARELEAFRASESCAEVLSANGNPPLIIHPPTEDLPEVHGSPRRLEQLFRNLTEFLSWGHEGTSTVTWLTQRRTLTESLRAHDAIEAGDYVVLRVAATRGAVPEEHLEHLFEPFYIRENLERTGTGLSLAVVYGVMKDAQGYVDVGNDGHGIYFDLFFPVAVETDEPLAEPETNIKGSESVLVVDDVLAQRDLATRQLTRLGYAVSSASSGEEALQMLLAEPVDLVVLDLNLEGGIDGLETYRRIREMRPEQAVIMASGFAEDSKIREALHLGARGSLRKPYRMGDLGKAIRSALQRDD